MRNPAPTARQLGPYQGYVEALSSDHIEGWVHSLADTTERVEIELFEADTGAILARTRADQHRWGLAEFGVGDGRHGFYVRFPAPLDADRAAQLRARCLGDGQELPLSPQLGHEYTPVHFVAMDIVDNCNLRCPFCVYDYAQTHATRMMSEPTLEAALQFLPYVMDGHFFFSCLHEPTLHPRLMSFVDKVPPQYRRKVFYTTNLAKRMPQSYFEWLAETGMHHLNISIESLKPAIYERMRKGARHRIFMENWDRLVAAIHAGNDPPDLRYIAMAYKSNLRELPDLVKYLLDERAAAQVELRYTFDEPHIPAAFRQSEFLEPAEWLWLQEQLEHYPAQLVLLSLPPGLTRASAANTPPPPAAGGENVDVSTPTDAGPADPPVAEPDIEALLGAPLDFNFPELAPEAMARFMRGCYEFTLSATGRLVVNRAAAGHRADNRIDGKLMETHVRNVTDAADFLGKLPF